MNKLLQYLMSQPNVEHRILPGLQKMQKAKQPCYECGGSVKRYDVGGFYDCPDQEKDPETGKCKAEVVRGREAAAANKAAAADMNAWAKQVAAMDKENARQNAAQTAGQLSFDYDWMQSPVDKADKKAAMAQYKQFFQQNPKVFVPDDTSGYSPEQKYIIASKLKQRLSTPMGAQLAQKKFGVDPRYYDLQRMQSELAPKMGGWEGMRNFLFNVYKQKGGSINQNAFTLPEVVVIGGKDKPTVNAYQKETDKLVYSDNDPYYGVDEYANHYAKTQIAKQYGVPKIRPTKAPSGIKSFMRNRSGITSSTNIPNPSYMPRTKTTYANFNDRYTQEYLPELSHYVSQNRQGFFDYNKGRLLDGLEYLKGNSPYKVKGTEENFAHEVIQPEVTQAFMDKFEEGRAMAMSAAASAMERKKLEKKKQEGGEYDLPQAQWGQFISPVDMGMMASKVMNFFGFNKQPNIVRTPASAPKRLSIRDPSKVMMTTGKSLRPNSDLVTGQYDSEHLGNLLTEAKRRNMSYNDMMNLAAMGFQETKWGRSDDNIGHTKGEFGDEPMQDSYSNFIDAYNAKMKDADRLKIKDEATRLQVYNGLGKIFPSTEADYHGFKMQKIYGVPVPKGGIDLRKNPLYGKQVIDIRDNVLKRNPEFMRYMDSTYRAPMPKQQFAQGGPILDPRGQWAHPGKITRIPSSNITMQGVPYPVLGIGSNGQQQMMYPGQEYNFGGASYVDEYPMMQDGGSIPVIEDAGDFNEEGVWVPDHDAMARQAKKLGARKVKTRSGSILYFDKNWNITSADDNPMMQKGGSTKKSKSNYTEVDSEDADVFRSLIPLPDNASQMLAKVLFKDARMSNNSLSDDQKLILWNTIQNAKKRSGIKTGGGTEYQDYGNQGYGSSDDFNQWFNRGKMGPLDVIRYSLTNPGYKLASTIGRGRYFQDPNNPDDILYTDVYDWNPSEANFSGSNAYQLLRNFLRSGEDKNLNKEKNDKYRMNFKLSKKEIDEIKKRKEEEAKGIMGLGLFKNGGQHGGLDRWFAEKWVDVKTGKACGRQEGEKRAGYPACRPSRRVSSETPKTASEMSPAEKAKFKANKTSSQRINYNHKRNK